MERRDVVLCPSRAGESRRCFPQSQQKRDSCNGSSRKFSQTSWHQVCASPAALHMHYNVRSNPLSYSMRRGTSHLPDSPRDKPGENRTPSTQRVASDRDEAHLDTEGWHSLPRSVQLYSFCLAVGHSPLSALPAAN